MYFLTKTYPLGFKFGQAYPNKEPFIGQGLSGQKHLGDDVLTPIGTVGIATLAGVGKYVKGVQGGHQLHFVPDGRNHLLRFMHLKQQPKTGRIEIGDEVFVTGNSGSATNAPHVHSDIYDLNKGPFNTAKFENFMPPSTYQWEEVNQGDTMQAFMLKDKKTIYAASGNTLFPFASAAAFEHAGGRYQDVKILEPTEFFKFRVMMETPIIKSI